MNISIVLGAGFGDEGKGRTVSYLASKFNDNNITNETCIVRFNGGQQAGHTVNFAGLRHIFSHFGSATLQNVPTYWSKFCSIYPTSFLNEYFHLTKFGIRPEIFIDSFCPVTTPYDIEANKNCDVNVKDGTCGLGFGKTIARHETLKLFFMDLFNQNILKAKLENIKDYYNVDKTFSISTQQYLQTKIDIFIDECKTMANILEKHYNINKLFDFKNLIFEGAQGILLDKDFGFFPNVTRSNTTVKNAIKIISDLSLDIFPKEIFYITRAYQTRHGNGFMSNESQLDLINNEKETNVFNSYQGKFRVGYFDLNLFNYAIECNRSLFKFNSFKVGLKENLVVTCLDQFKKDSVFQYLENNEMKYSLRNLFSKFTSTFDNIYISEGDETNKITKLFDKKIIS